MFFKMLSYASRYSGRVSLCQFISYPPAAYAASTRGGQLTQSQMGLRFRWISRWRYHTRNNVLAAMNINLTVLWVVTPCCFVDRCQRFGGTGRLILISEQLFFFFPLM